MKKYNYIDIVVVKPDKKPFVTTILNNLKAYQDCVEGFIEVIGNDDDTLLICNEEGKIKNLKGNRYYGNDIIAGTFFICGSAGDNFRSLTKDEQIKYLKKFDDVPKIKQEEVEKSLEIFFY